MAALLDAPTELLAVLAAVLVATPELLDAPFEVADALAVLLLAVKVDALLPPLDEVAMLVDVAVELDPVVDPLAELLVELAALADALMEPLDEFSVLLELVAAPLEVADALDALAPVDAAPLDEDAPTLPDEPDVADVDDEAFSVPEQDGHPALAAMAPNRTRNHAPRCGSGPFTRSQE